MLARSRHVDDAVDDGVSDVNSLGGQLFGHALSDGAQPMFARCKGRELGARLDRSGRSRKQDRAAPLRQHVFCRFAPHHECAKRSRTPERFEVFGTRFEQWGDQKTGGVVNRNLHGSEGGFGPVENGRNIGGVRRVARDREGTATGGLDLTHQLSQSRRVAPRHDYGVPVPGKHLRNLCARAGAGTDNHRGSRAPLLLVRHCGSFNRTAAYDRHVVFRESTRSPERQVQAPDLQTRFRPPQRLRTSSSLLAILRTMREASVGVWQLGWLVFGVFFVGCGGKTVEGTGDDAGDPDPTSTTSSSSATSSATSGSSTTGAGSNFTSECLAFCERLDCDAIDVGDCRDGCRNVDPECVADYRNAFACFNRVFDPGQACEDALLEAALTCQSSFERVDDCEGGDEFGPMPGPGAPPPE